MRENIRNAGLFKRLYSQRNRRYLGYDLAIKRNADSSVDALLYVYEGGAVDGGIPLSGQVVNKRLAVQGTWIEPPD